jgi:hypothetical protein
MNLFQVALLLYIFFASQLFGLSQTGARSAASGGTVYYVANKGSDSNDGLSPERPWKTIAKINASAALLKPGTSILLHRGDVFRDDYIHIEDQVKASASTTLTSDPPAVAGTAAKPITFGAYGVGTDPILDGSDPLSTKWAQVTPTTWRATVSKLPGKLYVDSPLAETQALVPQPNAVGGWKANTAYQYLDLVQANGSDWIVYGVAGASPIAAFPSREPFVNVTNTAKDNTSQSFSSTKTGLENVESTPGSWYETGSTVYVHLADGGDPNKHLISGTYRPFGVLLMSVNYVTVRDLIVERTQKGGIALGTYSDSSLPGHYYTNEYNTVVGNSVWNWGDLGASCMPQQQGCIGQAEAAILSKAFSSSRRDGEPLRGTRILNNYVGRSDQYFGLRSSAMVSGIMAIGQDNALIQKNRVITINNRCISYSAIDYVPSNIGGDVGYNFCGNNQGNYWFQQTSGGRIHHNIAANSFGEGIQIGGNDTHLLVDHNLLYNLSRTASTIGYNGIDCNSSGSYTTELNNTIVNVWGASISLETGCDHAYIANNVLDQRDSGKSIYFYYWLAQSSPEATFRNNLYSTTKYAHPWGYAFQFADWEAHSGETGGVQADPIYRSPVEGDFRLHPSSAGVGRSIKVMDVPSNADLGTDLSPVH